MGIYSKLKFSGGGKYRMIKVNVNEVITSCAGCKWEGKRYQKCTCCIRNREMKDNYKGGSVG